MKYVVLYVVLYHSWINHLQFHFLLILRHRTQEFHRQNNSITEIWKGNFQTFEFYRRIRHGREDFTPKSWYWKRLCSSLSSYFSLSSEKKQEKNEKHLLIGNCQLGNTVMFELKESCSPALVLTIITMDLRSFFSNNY